MNFKFATTLLLIAALLIAPALAQREAVMTLERSQASSPYVPFCGIVGCLMCCLNGLNGGVSRSMCSLLFDSLLAYCCLRMSGFFWICNRLSHRCDTLPAPRPYPSGSPAIRSLGIWDRRKKQIASKKIILIDMEV